MADWMAFKGILHSKAAGAGYGGLWAISKGFIQFEPRGTMASGVLQAWLDQEPDVWLHEIIQSRLDY
jgi:hypothetical protein